MQLQCITLILVPNYTFYFLLKALKIQQATHGKAHPGTAMTLTNIGKIYLRRAVHNNGGEAQKHAKRAEAWCVTTNYSQVISFCQLSNYL